MNHGWETQAGEEPWLAPNDSILADDLKHDRSVAMTDGEHEGSGAPHNALQAYALT